MPALVGETAAPPLAPRRPCRWPGRPPPRESCACGSRPRCRASLGHRRRPGPPPRRPAPPWSEIPGRPPPPATNGRGRPAAASSGRSASRSTSAGESPPAPHPCRSGRAIAATQTEPGPRGPLRCRPPSKTGRSRVSWMVIPSTKKGPRIARMKEELKHTLGRFGTHIVIFEAGVQDERLIQVEVAGWPPPVRE